MPGWIIQGVRGEGKSLAAVGKIKEYMLQGRPVATNLDLYLDRFLPSTCSTLAYRLPDHPRLEDFELLPPAYDVKYKGEDKNGLLVLDEMGTWLNSRSWNDKTRLKLMNWLFLSRKNHWDIILLAQDYEMIDAQARTTLCDYLVQASRLDRQNVPYLGSILKWFGFSGRMARVHRYHVFYGLSQQTPPVESWTFTGKDFYEGYDTNQRFRDGMEALAGTLVDCRGTYTYLPASYLTKQVFIDRYQQKIDDLKDSYQKSIQKVEPVAKKGVGSESNYVKIGFLAVGLVGFLVWRFASGGFSTPKLTPVLPAVSTAPAPDVQQNTLASLDNQVKDAAQSSTEDEPKKIGAQELTTFLDYLIRNYRPRLSSVAYSPDMGYAGYVNFYEGDVLRESYPIKSLHAMGVVLIHKDYGLDMVYKGKAYVVTAWKLAPPKQQSSAPVASSEPAKRSFPAG